MKIGEIYCEPRILKLRESYSISNETTEKCDNVFLRISTKNGYTGWGCAAPVESVTGETSDSVVKCFNESIEPVVKGEDAFSYARIIETLKSEIPDHPSALAMVDMAIYDLIAQKAGVPLFKLLGGYRRSIPTSVTIGIMPVNATLGKARQYIEKGYSILKIKGGVDPDEDIEKIKLIRKKFGTEIRLRFDANQGYNVNDSLRFIKETQEAGIELFEQPTPKSELNQLEMVTRQTNVPVMADESILSLKDVFQLSKDKATDLINIKLMKAGGITEGLHINSVAKAAGIEVMVGCMDESAISIAAGLHFALSRPNIAYADLDGHLDILDDPFKDMLSIEAGILFPPESSGLGWTEVNMKDI